MGFFSWKTCDTNKSISNSFSTKGAKKVKMIDNQGRFWIEENYQGYGIFGSKDFYSLLAEMNGKNGREEGIELAFADDTKDIKFPKFVEVDYKGNYEDLPNPQNCEFQGFFYQKHRRNIMSLLTEEQKKKLSF